MTGEKRRAGCLLRIVKYLAMLLGGMLLLAGIVIAWNWTFLHRAWTCPEDRSVTDIGWYTPLETVQGAPGSPLPTARAEEAGISQEALEQAARYADKKNSSALLVLVNDRIVLERYWRGDSAQGRTNSMSMAKTVLAL